MKILDVAFYEQRAPEILKSIKKEISQKYSHEGYGAVDLCFDKISELVDLIGEDPINADLYLSISIDNFHDLYSMTRQCVFLYCAKEIGGIL